MALNRQSKILLEQKRAERTRLKIKENAQKIHKLRSDEEAKLEEDARLNKLLVQICHKYEEIEVMEIAAIKIQKVVRGYLTRNNLDNLVIAFRQRSIQNWVKVLGKSTFRSLFHMGYMPDKAAIVIQKAVKRFLFRRKIGRLQEAYYYMLHEKMYIAFALIRKVVYSHLAKQKARWRQFKIDRIAILDAMKYKLAALQIKKHWKRMRMSMRSMLLKIRKYKRRLKNLEKAKAVEAMRNASPEPEAKPEGEQEGEGEPEEFDSEEERIMREEQRLKEEKIKMGKISYNIQKTKINNEVMPFMYQKDLQEEAELVYHHQDVTRATASRMLSLIHI